jgi:hypothetical protein
MENFKVQNKHSINKILVMKKKKLNKMKKILEPTKIIKNQANIRKTIN